MPPSSKHKEHKGKGKTTHHGPLYPTEWSRWEWHPETQSERRYRLRTADPTDYQFEYRDHLEEDPLAPEVPRTRPSGAGYKRHDSYGSVNSGNYTTSVGLEDITRDLPKMSLQPSAGQYGQFPSIPSSREIVTKDDQTQEEGFDPHYRVHDAKDFVWGRVFKIVWSEPRGDNGTGRSSVATQSERKDDYGRKFFAETRRFVIVSLLKGHCICLPINTYQGKGVNKPGVHAPYHAPIYTDHPKPLLDGERSRGLTRKAIKVVPDTSRHKLLTASRLNYAQLYTVQYNVKVWFIGKVHQDSEARLSADYNSVHQPMSPGGRAATSWSADTSSYQIPYQYNPSGGRGGGGDGSAGGTGYAGKSGYAGGGGYAAGGGSGASGGTGYATGSGYAGGAGYSNSTGYVTGSGYAGRGGGTSQSGGTSYYAPSTDPGTVATTTYAPTDTGPYKSSNTTSGYSQDHSPPAHYSTPGTDTGGGAYSSSSQHQDDPYYYDIPSNPADQYGSYEDSPGGHHGGSSYR